MRERIPVLALAAIVVLLGISNVKAQIDLGGIEPRPFTIIAYDCIGCEGLAERLPAPEYEYVGFGAHEWTGFVQVAVSVDNDGKVTSANAISGHTFFRIRFEDAARKARFKPLDRVASGMRHKMIIKYLVIGKLGLEPLDDAGLKLGIINGLATELPSPEMSAEAKKMCANGTVDIRVTLDEEGNVISATPRSGDPLLVAESVDSAKRSKFKNQSHMSVNEGIIRYTYSLPEKCRSTADPGLSLTAGITAPRVPDDCECGGKVRVDVVVDPSNSRPVRARAISGLPLLRPFAEEAAMTGSYTLSSSFGLPGLLKHTVTIAFSDSTPPTNKTDCKKVGTVGHYPPGTKPIEKSEPVFSEAVMRENAGDTVNVVVLVNEDGVVATAQAVSGNPTLHEPAEKAAMKFRWKPHLIGGCPVRVRTMIVFQVSDEHE